MISALKAKENSKNAKVNWLNTSGRSVIEHSSNRINHMILEKSKQGYTVIGVSLDDLVDSSEVPYGFLHIVTEKVRMELESAGFLIQLGHTQGQNHILWFISWQTDEEAAAEQESTPEEAEDDEE